MPPMTRRTATSPSAAAPEARASATTLESVLTTFESLARDRVASGPADELTDPQVLHRRAERLLNELERVRREQDERRRTEPDWTNLLLCVAETQVPWSSVFPVVLDRSREAVEGPDAHVVVAPELPGGTLSAMFTDCDAMRARVLQACNGADPRSKAAADRRAAVFSRPPFTASKPAWENELRSLSVAITKMGPSQTAALRLLVPQLGTLLARLEKVLPQSGGRPVTRKHWSPAVVHAQALIAIVIDELIQLSAAIEGNVHNAALLQIAAPKRRGDEAAPADNDERKKPAQDKKPAPIEAAKPETPKSATAPVANGAAAVATNGATACEAPAT